MTTRIPIAVVLVLMTAFTGIAADHAPLSTLNPERAQETKKYPLIVIYTVSWCPHCRATKEYLTRNNIPFINRDVELDPQAMELLTGKYHSQGVPVIVIGTGENEIVLRGFTSEQFEDSLKKAQMKK